MINMCRSGIIHFLLVTELIFSHNPKANGKTLLGTRMMLTSGLVMTDKNPSSLQHPIQCRPLQNQNPVGNTKPKSVRTMCEKKLFLHPLFSSTSLPNESLARGWLYRTPWWAKTTWNISTTRIQCGKKIDKWNKKRVITTSAALHQQLRSVLEAVSLFTSPFIRFLSLLMCLSHSPPPLTENKQRPKISYQ